MIKVTFKYAFLVVLSLLCSIEIMAQSKMEEAKKMIQDGKAECVLIKNYRACGSGNRHLR